MTAPAPIKQNGRIVVILCRGIGEPYAQNLLTYTVRNLDPKLFMVVELVWSAEFGPVPRWNGNSFGVNVAQAERALRELIALYPGAVVLGYSGGAQVAGNVAAAIARDPKSLGLWIRAVGLISDPSRHTTQIVGVNRGGQGIMGGRLIPTGKFHVWQLSAWGDPISELPDEAKGLAILAQGIEFFSLVDPIRWMDNLRWKALTGRLRFWDTSINWAKAHQWSLGYTHDGRHTCYAREKMQGSDVTYADRLGQLVAGVR
ncbi:hypothetical protein [Rhodococcoides fascians]|uniref:hypothetical protein n=1 Tax=Rhodococcoides fascians TaxID=1828 RepID=UPI00068A7245|nr:hypothetical protein [Rhodococcus fascians]